MESTLVLNASFEPLGIISASRALNKVLSGKATAVDNSSKVFRAEHTEMFVPYVIQMNYMVNRKRHGRLGFSRRGVLVRDNYKCAYCGKSADTIDHVIPRSRGGENSYKNCVAACYKCNNKKSDRMIEDIGWKLNFTPYEPSPYSMLLLKASKASEAGQVWSKYVTPWEQVRVPV